MKDARKITYLKKIGEALYREASTVDKIGAPRIHIIPVSESWHVKKEGATKASRVFSVKTEAVKFAEGQVKNGKSSSFVVHLKDGSVELSSGTLEVA